MRVLPPTGSLHKHAQSPGWDRLQPEPSQPGLPPAAPCLLGSWGRSRPSRWDVGLSGGIGAPVPRNTQCACAVCARPAGLRSGLRVARGGVGGGCRISHFWSAFCGVGGIPCCDNRCECPGRPWGPQMVFVGEAAMGPFGDPECPGLQKGACSSHPLLVPGLLLHPGPSGAPWSPVSLLVVMAASCLGPESPFLSRRAVPPRPVPCSAEPHSHVELSATVCPETEVHSSILGLLSQCRLFREASWIGFCL